MGLEKNNKGKGCRTIPFTQERKGETRQNGKSLPVPSEERGEKDQAERVEGTDNSPVEVPAEKSL